MLIRYRKSLSIIYYDVLHITVETFIFTGRLSFSQCSEDWTY